MIGAWNRGKSHAMQQPIATEILDNAPEPHAPEHLTRPAAEPGAHAAWTAAQEPIPDLVYDLRWSGGCSDGYYDDVSRFSDRLLAEIELHARQAISGYAYFAQTELRESPRSNGEYAIELLTLGMTLKLYAGAAGSTPGWAVRWARGLFRMRCRWERTKPLADLVRRWITRLYLMPNIGRTGLRQYSIDRLPGLIEWLEATGEFEQECVRLGNWLSFLRSLPAAEAEQLLDTSVHLFACFEQKADQALGTYTRGVSEFLAGEYAARGCREDQLFCAKRPVEYHLNMVAAEIMNRGLRAEFERKRCRVVLVPACMRGPYETFCRAKTSGVDIQCAACSPGCRVNRITRRMRDLGAKVFLVPHASGFSRWLERWQREPDTAVAAVACMLNILPGGYEMRARGIASQCLPLDYPGCQKHWRKEGIATGLNEDRLVNIVAAFPH
jgi:hypothetical protein